MSSFGALRNSPSLGALAHGPRLPPGFVHAWTLDNTTSGYVDFAHGLTLTQQGSGMSTAAGIVGDAASFNGNGRLQSSADVSLIQSGFAAEAWIYSTDTANPQQQRIAVGQDGGATSSSLTKLAWTLGISNISDNRVVYVDVYTSTADYKFTAVGASPNTWYHVVGSITDRMRLYVNGTLAATPATYSGALITTAQPVTVGGRIRPASVGTANWIGRIDEPRIWQFGAAGDPGAAFWLARYNNGLGRRP